MNRRDLLKQAAAVGVLGVTGVPFVLAQTSPNPHGGAPSGAATPPPFAPKGPADPKPLENELQKYPKCAYCGMDRAEYHDRRHLVQYEGDLIDPTCSLHCTALSLSLNMDLGPKAIYVADYGSTEKVKPMVNVEKARYLVGSDVKGVMTSRSKLAFADEKVAKDFQAKHRGDLVDFDKAMTAAHSDMATDTVMIRKRRAEKRSKQK
jgi:copper chaperone NosL